MAGAKPVGGLPASASHYAEASEVTDAILDVDGKELHVNKGILMLASPVFNNMFSGKFKDNNERLKIELLNKDLQTVVWMLDCIYPNRQSSLTDEKAAKLIPLADEYQLDELKRQCAEVLMEMKQPRLEIVAIAQKYELKKLLDKAIDKCAETIQCTGHSYYSGEDFDKQLKRPENAEISKDNLIRIYRKKLSLAFDMTQKVSQGKSEVSHALNQSSRNRHSAPSGSAIIAKLVETLENTEFDKKLF